MMTFKGIPMANTARTASERVHLRMTPTTKQTLQRAADATNKTLTEFLLDAGLNAALDAVEHRRVFQLDDNRWSAFMAALAIPPKTNPRLRKLLARRAAWEQ
jgi:uncharacterized protein (DUF1778 family)